MSLAKKTVISFLTFFLSLFIISTFSLVISPVISSMNENIVINIAIPFFSTLVLISFALLQGLIRYLFHKKALDSNTTLLSVSISKFIMREKIIFYLLLIFFYLLPLLRGIIFDYTLLIRIMLFIGSVFFIQMLLRKSNKNTKIFFQRNGLLITGFDARIEIPFRLNVYIHNDSGYYSYNDIENYFIYSDRIELYLVNSIGKIVFHANGELKRQVTGLMVQNNIPIRNISE